MHFGQNYKLISEATNQPWADTLFAKFEEEKKSPKLIQMFAKLRPGCGVLRNRTPLENPESLKAVSLLRNPKFEVHTRAKSRGSRFSYEMPVYQRIIR